MREYKNSILAMQLITLLTLCVFLSQNLFAGRIKSKVENEVVQFPTGSSPYIVAFPKTELQKRITARLADYMSKVLGKPAKIVTAISNVPVGFPAIVLIIKPATADSAKTSKEAFMLETKKLQGHAAVIATGNSELGLKHAVQRLVIKSEQRNPGLVIPALSISESPWIPKREWTLCPMHLPILSNFRGQKRR